MVKSLYIDPKETYESRRASKLMIIVQETLGPDGVPINARGEHIEVGLSTSTQKMDIYHNLNQIYIYTPGWRSIATKVADAFEKEGEKEFTVMENYN